MSMIRVEDLTFSYPSSGEAVLEHADFQIDTDWRLGFIGRNGRGKTTFLNLLQGKYEYQGKILSSVEFDYFPYEIKEPGRWTKEAAEEICPSAEEWEIRKELFQMNVEEDVLWRPFETLSNGEQTKVLLACLFLNEGHFLLIDEPTNHLDAEARMQVAEYLKRKKGFILVSHDRRFLDICVDHVLAFNRAGIEVQSGNFSSWWENFQRQQNFEWNQNQKLQKDIKRLKQSAERKAQWSDRVEASKKGAADKGYVGHKSAKMMKRAKHIEARQNAALEEKSLLLKNLETAEDIKVLPLSYHSKTLASLSQVSAVYEGRCISFPVTYSVYSGERLCLRGRNGSGKSSILKLLAGQSLEHAGTVSVGSGLIVSYVPQDVSWLKGTLGAFEEREGVDRSLFRAMLRKLDFDRSQFDKRMEDFSMGQKKKVLIAKSLCEKAHLYVWDEPLNYIDIYSRMQIEDLILEHGPAMVLVEHDQAFIEAIGARVIEVERRSG